MFSKIFSCLLIFVFFLSPVTPVVQAQTQIELNNNCLAPVSELSTRDITRAINMKNLKSYIEKAYNDYIVTKYNKAIEWTPNSSTEMTEEGTIILGVGIILDIVFAVLFFKGVDVFAATGMYKFMAVVGGLTAAYPPLKLLFAIIKTLAKLVAMPFKRAKALSVLAADKNKFSDEVQRVYKLAEARLEKELKEVKVDKNGEIDKEILEFYINNNSNFRYDFLLKKINAYISTHKKTVNQADLLSFIDSVYFEYLIKSEVKGAKDNEYDYELNNLRVFREFVIHRANDMKHANWSVVKDALQKSYKDKLQKLEKELETDLEKAKVYNLVKKTRDVIGDIPYTEKRLALPPAYYNLTVELPKYTGSYIKEYDMEIIEREQRLEEEKIANEKTRMEEEAIARGEYEEYTSYRRGVVGTEEYFENGSLNKIKTQEAHQKVIEAHNIKTAELNQKYDTLIDMINKNKNTYFNPYIVNNIFSTEQAKYFLIDSEDFLQNIVYEKYGYDTFLGLDLLKERIKQTKLLSIAA